MFSTRLALVSVALLSALGLVAGCDKKVKLEFDNMTAQPLDVSVSGPGVGHEMVGYVGPHGRLRHTVKVPKDVLPATLTWQAGQFQGPITITKDTEGPLFIRLDDVFGPSGPMDKNTEVQQERTFQENKQVEQYEVPE